jgi:hypothetical protein
MRTFACIKQSVLQHICVCATQILIEAVVLSVTKLVVNAREQSKRTEQGSAGERETKAQEEIVPRRTKRIQAALGSYRLSPRRQLMNFRYWHPR